MINRLTLLLTVFFSYYSTDSFAGFDYNENCRQAMVAVLDLRTQTARELLQKEHGSSPENGYVVYLEHYCDAVELIVTEDIGIYARIMENYDSRMVQIEELDDGSPVSSWLQAEMLFQTGLAQVKYGTRISGVYKMLSAYNRIREIRRNEPKFWQTLKLTGAFNIILSNIPPYMRWAADIFGFSGNQELGLYELKEYVRNASDIPGLAEEGIIMANLGFLLAGKEEDAFRFISSQDPLLLETALVKYIHSNSATFVYRNDIALKLLAAIDPAELQVPFYAIPYATGRCKLNHLELDAIIHLENFINNYKVEDYKKAACNRLSFAYFLKGDIDKYQEYRQKVFSIGQSLRDRDQEAILESSDPLMPHPGLLKARLLCDGGYFNEALAIMNSIDNESLAEKAYQVEFSYRLGRIFQLSGEKDKAIEALTKAFNDGKYEPLTFATRSALQLGRIYEEGKDKDQALKWYQNCLDTFDPSHTTAGVESSAQKAMRKLKGE